MNINFDCISFNIILHLKDKITKKATRHIYNETNKNPEEIKI